jgi:hypothetical protein
MNILARPREGRLRLLLAAAVALLGVGLWWAFTVWEPGPPRTVVMAAGPEGSAYAAFGARYRAILARSSCSSLPAVYGWAMRRRVFRLYGELKVLEIEVEERGAAASADLLARLEDLDARASHLRVSRGQAWLAYTLRHHIRLVRERLQKQA